MSISEKIKISISSDFTIEPRHYKLKRIRLVELQNHLGKKEDQGRSRCFVWCNNRWVLHPETSHRKFEWFRSVNKIIFTTILFKKSFFKKFTWRNFHGKSSCTTSQIIWFFIILTFFFACLKTSFSTSSSNLSSLRQTLSMPQQTLMHTSESQLRAFLSHACGFALFHISTAMRIIWNIMIIAANPAYFNIVVILAAMLKLNWKIKYLNGASKRIFFLRFKNFAKLMKIIFYWRFIKWWIDKGIMSSLKSFIVSENFYFLLHCCFQQHLRADPRGNLWTRCNVELSDHEYSSAERRL